MKVSAWLVWTINLPDKCFTQILHIKNEVRQHWLTFVGFQTFKMKGRSEDRPCNFKLCALFIICPFFFWQQWAIQCHLPNAYWTNITFCNLSYTLRKKKKHTSSKETIARDLCLTLMCPVTDSWCWRKRKRWWGEKGRRGYFTGS